MSYDFHYIRTGTGELSGPSLVTQTELALNEIGAGIETAETALSTAESALTAANNAQSAADTAQRTADEALATAKAAQSGSNAATESASEALAVAQAAQETADAAQETADGKADIYHASSETTYGVGTSELYGHVKLSDDVDVSLTADSGTAATPYALSTVQDAAETAAEAAQNAAEVAQSAAETAQTAAEGAQEAAEAAQTSAETAQTTAEAAQTTADEAYALAESAKANSATADALTEAVSIYVNLASDEAALFDGTEDITPGVFGILPEEYGGTGESDLDDVSVGYATKAGTADSATTATSADTATTATTATTAETATIAVGVEAYSDEGTYSVGQLVTYNGGLYLCLVENGAEVSETETVNVVISPTDDTDGEYWEEADDDTDTTDATEYDATADYAEGDVVSVDGVYYVCITAHGPNTETEVAEAIIVAPDDDDSGGTYWQALSGGSSSSSSALYFEITIPAEGWTETTDGNGDALYYIDITLDSVSEDTIPILSIYPQYLTIASDCGLYTSAQTFDGYLRLYSAEAPASEILADLTLIGAISTSTATDAEVEEMLVDVFD